MFWSGHSRRPSNSDVNQHNICKNTVIHSNINKFCVHVRVIVSESSANKYNTLKNKYFEIKNRRQGPKTAGYHRKPAAISNPVNI